MIKIQFFEDDIKDYYLETMLSEIEARFNKNPSYFLKNEKGNFSAELAKTLLTGTREEVQNNDKFKLYFEVIKLIEKKNFKVDVYLKEKERPICRYERQNAREELLAEARKIDKVFIDGYTANHQGYLMNSKSFSDLITDMEKDAVEKLEFIFSYDELLCGKQNKNGNAALITMRHKLLTSLNVPVCPYCNRQYITTYEKTEDDERTTADLDHFYPKSKYPLFALSLFNFIPSCHVCNSQMKGAKTAEIIYPYEEGFGNDAYFSVSSNGDCKNLLKLWRGEKDVPIFIDIQTDTSDKEKEKRIQNSIDTFNLNKVYQSHEEYVRELLVKKRVYNEGAYSDSLEKIFKKLNLRYTPDELERFLYGFHWQDGEDAEHPLSKLTYDIVKR